MSTSLKVSDSERPETNGDPGRPDNGDSERATTCERFVILSMQRSGSREAEHILNDGPLTRSTIRCEGEFFNFDKGQPGRTHAGSLDITPDEVRRHGVRWWYQKVFETLDQVQFELHGAKPHCAVGFRAFENPEVYGSKKLDGWMDFGFNYDEMKPLLEDPTVKKIVLDRDDTNAQWFSLQRSCYFRDMSDHHEHDSHSDQQQMTTEHVQNGEFCGPPIVSNFTLFEQTKHNMYRRWYDLLESTSQPYVAIKTEDLDKLMADASQLREFLFPSANQAAN